MRWIANPETRSQNSPGPPLKRKSRKLSEKTKMKTFREPRKGADYSEMMRKVCREKTVKSKKLYSKSDRKLNKIKV
jgi:hypothetical protein